MKNQDYEHSDKSDDALAAQRFQMLEDLARELSGPIVFPTNFDVAARIRRLANDPDVTLKEMALAVSADPLISSKLLAMANSSAYADAQPLNDIFAAVSRLGLENVCSVSLSIAMRQIVMLGSMIQFADLANLLWIHTLRSASACYVVAKRMTNIDPNVAFFAGMVHDIGAFYMLYRANKYPELVARPESLKFLVVKWHESIGESLMNALGVPSNIVEATCEHDRLRKMEGAPDDLKDVVYVGNVLAGAHFEWLYNDVDIAEINRHALGPQYKQHEAEIDAHAQSIAAFFK